MYYKLQDEESWVTNVEIIRVRVDIQEVKVKSEVGVCLLTALR